MSGTIAVCDAPQTDADFASRGILAGRRPRANEERATPLRLDTAARASCCRDPDGVSPPLDEAADFLEGEKGVDVVEVIVETPEHRNTSRRLDETGPGDGSGSKPPAT